ncbi:MAG: aminoglycoside phosphotransferase family protein [Lachnospiraceae bacterium]|nr:aminoglycoside phosphotransferase family protein [Lachnospiraceae bacterium]
MNFTELAVGPCRQIQEAIQAFLLPGTVSECCRYGNGHINDTFCLTMDTENNRQRFILQRINTHVFQDPKGLMRNISGVTQFLRREILAKGGDPDRETLTLIPAKSGDCCYCDSAGFWWRIYRFIEDASTYDVVRRPEDFYQSARAFGHFQRLLAGYPVAELMETIPDFHNTPVRFQTFLQAVQKDPCGRAGQVQEEIRFVLERECDIPVIMDLLNNGRMPRRVTHNDTKLNNIMLDDATGKALCVIDLDTIMPGASVFDYGDSIRFGANTGEEDEQDLSKVSLSLELFKTYTKGFLDGCEGSLTDLELTMLPMGAKLMTLECGMRFLTDYLQGDTYFRTHREGQNLDRCRSQFALVADMEKKWDQMHQMVADIAAAFH